MDFLKIPGFPIFIIDLRDVFYCIFNVFEASYGTPTAPRTDTDRPRGPTPEVLISPEHPPNKFGKIHFRVQIMILGGISGFGDSGARGGTATAGSGGGRSGSVGGRLRGVGRARRAVGEPQDTPNKSELP